MKKKSLAGTAAVISVCVFVILIIAEPSVCTDGAANGLLLCGRVIIPALFPFTACVLFILKSGVLSRLSFAAPFTKRVFRISPDGFTVMLLSLIGGYPVGAKLINESVALKKITPENAGVMLNYCVNAGPAFVILAVGGGIIGSRSVGYILLAAHLISAVIIGFFSRFFMTASDAPRNQPSKALNPADNFVLSVSEAASAVFGICGYVLLFSTVNAYIEHFSAEFPFLSCLSCILEVTNAVTLTRSVLFIAFLLGFGGICVWCQVLSVGGLIKFSFPMFFTARVTHGLLSAAVTAVLLKITGLSLAVFSNHTAISPQASSGGAALSVSMLCMTIIFLISLFTKKHTGKILDNLL